MQIDHNERKFKMNEKINYNKKHRFFKFIILWSITFVFMFSCSMIIYAIAVNVDEDSGIEAKENSIQIEIIDPNKAKLTHTDIKPEKVETSNVESVINIEKTETQDDVSQEEIDEELSI